MSCTAAESKEDWLNSTGETPLDEHNCVDPTSLQNPCNVIMSQYKLLISVLNTNKLGDREIHRGPMYPAKKEQEYIYNGLFLVLTLSQEKRQCFIQLVQFIKAITVRNTHNRSLYYTLLLQCIFVWYNSQLGIREC